jgi:hypothetical protein
MKCDFCSSEDAKYWYDAQDFDVYTVISKEAQTVGRSVGSWFACEHCARLIDKDDKDGLMKRVIDAGLRRRILKEETIPMVKLLMAVIHEGFWEKKTGLKNHVDN